MTNVGYVGESFKFLKHWQKGGFSLARKVRVLSRLEYASGLSLDFKNLEVQLPSAAATGNGYGSDGPRVSPGTPPLALSSGSTWTAADRFCLLLQLDGKKIPRVRSTTFVASASAAASSITGMDTSAVPLLTKKYVYLYTVYFA